MTTLKLICVEMELSEWINCILKIKVPGIDIFSPYHWLLCVCVCVCACARARAHVCHCKEKAWERVSHMPFCWFGYLSDIFVIWCHGPEKLQRFLDHLSSVCKNVQFTMETKRGSHCTFQSTDKCGRLKGLLGHEVYCIPTNSNLCLNSRKHHHSSRQWAILTTSVPIATDLC